MRIDFAFERARAMRHMCEKMRVWIRVLSFMELKVEGEEEDSGDFMEKALREWKVFG